MKIYNDFQSWVALGLCYNFMPNFIFFPYFYWSMYEQTKEPAIYFHIFFLSLFYTWISYIFHDLFYSWENDILMTISHSQEVIYRQKLILQLDRMLLIKTKKNHSVFFDIYM